MPDQNGKPEKSLRWKRRQERMARVAKQVATKRVRVNPTTDVIRRDIVHGMAGIRFPAEGSVEWPLDQFTKRRLRDGDVTLGDTGDLDEEQVARLKRLEDKGKERRQQMQQQHAVAPSEREQPAENQRGQRRQEQRPQSTQSTARSSS